MSDDKSLEDFFAKKKAKKGKNKSKFTTSDLLTKQASQPKKDGETKDQSNKKFTASNQTSSAKEDEEWKDFEQPQEKDYSGLRIQSLQISEKQEQEANEEEQQEEFNEDGELLAKKDKSSPWQQASAPQAVQVSKKVEEESHPNVVGSVYRPPGAYRPPGMRNKIAMGGGIKGKAPEINSEIAFPTLQAAVQDSKSKEPTGRKSFEMVRHGARSLENPADRRPNLDLGNKYEALRRS